MCLLKWELKCLQNTRGCRMQAAGHVKGADLEIVSDLDVHTHIRVLGVCSQSNSLSIWVTFSGSCRQSGLNFQTLPLQDRLFVVLWVFFSRHYLLTSLQCGVVCGLLFKRNKQKADVALHKKKRVQCRFFFLFCYGGDSVCFQIKISFRRAK